MQKTGDDKGGDCWMRDALHPRHRKACDEWDTRFFVAGEGRQRQKQILPRGYNEKGKGLFLQLEKSCPFAEKVVSSGVLSSGNEGKALNGDFCAVSGTFPGR